MMVFARRPKYVEDLCKVDEAISSQWANYQRLLHYVRNDLLFSSHSQRPVGNADWKLELPDCVTKETFVTR